MGSHSKYSFKTQLGLMTRIPMQRFKKTKIEFKKVKNNKIPRLLVELSKIKKKKISHKF